MKNKSIYVENLESAVEIKKETKELNKEINDLNKIFRHAFNFSPNSLKKMIDFEIPNKVEDELKLEKYLEEFGQIVVLFNSMEKLDKITSFLMKKFGIKIEANFKIEDVSKPNMKKLEKSYNKIFNSKIPSRFEILKEVIDRYMNFQIDVNKNKEVIKTEIIPQVVTECEVEPKYFTKNLQMECKRADEGDEIINLEISKLENAIEIINEFYKLGD